MLSRRRKKLYSEWLLVERTRNRFGIADPQGIVGMYEARIRMQVKIFQKKDRRGRGALPYSKLEKLLARRVLLNVSGANAYPESLHRMSSDEGFFTTPAYSLILPPPLPTVEEGDGPRRDPAGGSNVPKNVEAS